MAPRSLTDVLDALQRAAPLVREHAAEAERAGAYPREVVDALFEEGLFRLWIPRSLGGDELSLPDSLEVFEAASRIDGSAGWLVTIGVGGALFAATMEPETAREIYQPREALIAGSGAPSGRAIPVEGGYRVSGRWRYASGAHHASWITANCTIGEPSGDPSAPPPIRAMAFPAAEVQVHDTWDVSGMRATGSHDIEVRDAFVPSRFSFDVFGTPHESGSLYRLPFGSVASFSFGAVALGIAAHAIEAFTAEAQPARLEREDVRYRLGEARATLASARAFFFERARHVWALVEAGTEVSEADQATGALASSHARASAVQAVESLYLVSGMAPLFMSSEFGRCWRDVHTVSQHVALSPAAYAASN